MEYISVKKGLERVIAELMAFEHKCRLPKASGD